MSACKHRLGGNSPSSAPIERSKVLGSKQESWLSPPRPREPMPALFWMFVMKEWTSHGGIEEEEEMASDNHAVLPFPATENGETSPQRDYVRPRQCFWTKWKTANTYHLRALSDTEILVAPNKYFFTGELEIIFPTLIPWGPSPYRLISLTFNFHNTSGCESRWQIPFLQVFLLLKQLQCEGNKCLVHKGCNRQRGKERQYQRR